MKGRVSATLFALSVAWAARREGGAVLRDKSHNCLSLPATINFSSVPEISNEIVSQEKAAAAPEESRKTEPGAAPYTGPVIGVSRCEAEFDGRQQRDDVGVGELGNSP